MSLLEVNHIQKTYTSPFSATTVRALDDASFSVEPGEFAAIMGESGSGKTTLLNILAMLDTPDAGTILLKDRDVSRIPQRQRTRWRRDHLGFVFQDFNLLDTFTLKDNILLPMVLAKETVPAMMRKLTPVAELLGITDILTKFPYEVSGGQKQRAAIARALIRNPEILLADEPTGALDSGSSELVLDLFDAINQKGQTILMVTHSAQAASHASRVLFIKDGRVHHQIWKGNKDRKQMYEAIQQAQSLLLAKGN